MPIIAARLPLADVFALKSDYVHNHPRRFPANPRRRKRRKKWSRRHCARRHARQGYGVIPRMGVGGQRCAFTRLELRLAALALGCACAWEALCLAALWLRLRLAALALRCACAWLRLRLAALVLSRA
eukprot:gene10176-biopygen2223